jgi:hypothetical protein
MALVKCDDLDTPVTYQMCADMLGFTSTSMGAPVDMTSSVTYKITRNLDGQNHVHKGAFGCRIDEAQDVSISNVLVDDYDTSDAKQPTKALGSYTTQVDFGLSDDSEPESGVLKIRGVSINSCEDVDIENIMVKDSHAGSQIIGVEIRGQSEKIQIEEIRAERIEGREKANTLRVSFDSKEVEAKKISGESLVAEHAGMSAVVQIESPDTKLN